MTDDQPIGPMGWCGIEQGVARDGLVRRLGVKAVCPRQVYQFNLRPFAPAVGTFSAMEGATVTPGRLATLARDPVRVLKSDVFPQLGFPTRRTSLGNP